MTVTVDIFHSGDGGCFALALPLASAVASTRRAMALTTAVILDTCTVATAEPSTVIFARMTQSYGIYYAKIFCMNRTKAAARHNSMLGERLSGSLAIQARRIVLLLLNEKYLVVPCSLWLLVGLAYSP